MTTPTATPRVLVTTGLLAAFAAWSCSETSNAAAAGSGDSGAADTCSGESKCQIGDRDVLLACAAEEPCASGLAQLADQGPYTINPERMACILHGLEQRTPGRYVHQTDHTFGDGSAGAHHVLLVRADGTVRYARTTYKRGRPIEPEEVDDPGEQCTLRDPSYFSDCLDAVNKVEPRMRLEGPAWTCSFGDGSGVQPSALDWFKSCEPTPATCE